VYQREVTINTLTQKQIHFADVLITQQTTVNMQTSFSCL